MTIVATIMNSATGQPIQKMTFGRMPKPWASFNLESGELVTADRVHVGKLAPGKFVAPVEVWVTLKTAVRMSADNPHPFGGKDGQAQPPHRFS